MSSRPEQWMSYYLKREENKKTTTKKSNKTEHPPPKPKTKQQQPRMINWHWLSSERSEFKLELIEFGLTALVKTTKAGGIICPYDSLSGSGEIVSQLKAGAVVGIASACRKGRSAEGRRLPEVTQHFWRSAFRTDLQSSPLEETI